MRKAKRGLKRSEAQRGGHRMYVHKRRPEDRLTSGSAFARELRVRTTHFASESESRAISRSSQRPPSPPLPLPLPLHCHDGGGGGVGGGGGSGGGGGIALGERKHGRSVLGVEEIAAAGGGGGGGGWGEGEGGVGGDRGGGDGERGEGGLTVPMSSVSSWPPTASWGSKVLQAMSDAAHAPKELGVVAGHARVLREWKQRCRAGDSLSFALFLSLSLSLSLSPPSAANNSSHVVQIMIYRTCLQIDHTVPHLLVVRGCAGICTDRSQRR